MIQALLLPFGLILAVKMIGLIFLPPRDIQYFTPRYAALHTRLRLAGAFMLMVGLVAAISVHRNLRSAPEDKSDIVGYEIGTGYLYPIRAAYSKHYIDQMERRGGKGAVVTAEVTRWLTNPWRRGGKLASTLLLLSIGGFVIVCFILAQF